MRLRCRLLSCRVDYDPDCVRCGAYIYDDVIQFGLIDRAWRFIRWELFYWWPDLKFRCANCGRWMRPTEEYCCSQRCFDEWLPF